MEGSDVTKATVKMISLSRNTNRLYKSTLARLASNNPFGHALSDYFAKASNTFQHGYFIGSKLRAVSFYYRPLMTFQCTY